MFTLSSSNLRALLQSIPYGARTTSAGFAIILAAGACSLAGSNSGSASSNLGGGDGTGGDGSGGGAALLTCSAPNVAMPADIPDVTNCFDDGTNPAVTTGCRGWTKVGPYLSGTDELRSVAQAGAQLYTINPDANTLCLYLYRGDKTASQGSLNGMHCYDTRTCDVCWWDGATNANTLPTAADLSHASNDDCSDCHRDGPLLPKFALWSDAQAITRGLHEVCAAAGGGTWADPVAAWPLANPDPESVIPAPSSCSGNSCHASGFARGGSYCTLVNHAFADDNGSMRGNGETFASKTECTDFRSAMGCADADLPCDDEAVAAPDDADGGTEAGASDSPVSDCTGIDDGTDCNVDGVVGTCQNETCQPSSSSDGQEGDVCDCPPNADLGDGCVLNADLVCVALP